MKQSLRLIPIFFILFLLVYLLFTAFTFAYEWLLAAPHTPGEAFRATVPALPSILLRTLPPALLFSLFALLFFRRSHRSSSFFGSLLVLILACLLYGGLFYYLSNIEPRTASPKEFSPIEKGQLQEVGETLLFTENVSPMFPRSSRSPTSPTSGKDLSAEETEGEAKQFPEDAQTAANSSRPQGKAPPNSDLAFALETVLLVSLDKETPPFMQLYPEATAEPRQQRIVFGEERPALEYERETATGIRDLRPPRFLHSFSREMAAVTKHLQKLLEHSLLFFAVAAGVQVLWSISAWGLLRVSSWPLFNALLALLAFRGLFFLWETFRSDIVAGTLEPLLPQQFMPLLPAAVFLLLSLLMLAVSSLVRPQREES